VLRRFLLDNRQYVEDVWCTGADLNTSNEVIQDIIQDELNLESGFHCLGKMLHSRFGIENQSKKMLARIREKINPIFPLSESATGYSVAKCIDILVPKEAKIVIQGFGAVGKSLAYFIQTKGLGKIVGITESNGFIYHEEGIDIAALFAQQNDDSIPGTPLSDMLNEEARRRYNWTDRGAEEVNEDYLVRFLNHVQADVFCPCATRYQITGKVVQTLLNTTFAGSAAPFIISGANNIYDNTGTFEAVEASPIETIPEWVSNCGNALLFMESLKSQENGRAWVDAFLAEVKVRLETFFASLHELDASLSLHRKCYEQIKNKVDSALLCNN
jgi:glutamate dehydrogenase (NAD(P)+)